MCGEDKPVEGDLYGLAATDPEYAAFLSAFMRGEVRDEPGANHPDLDARTRAMAVLAALIGCQGLDVYARELGEALDAGVTPVEAKEIVYQATAYLGVGRVLPFVERTNAILGERGVALPLAGQATTSPDTRVQAGEEAQVAIFGRPHARVRAVGARGDASYQPVAVGQLFRRLLHAHRPRPSPSRDDHPVLPGRAGRMRAAADQPCDGQHARRQRSRVPDRGRLPVHAVPGLSAHAQRDPLHRRGRQGHAGLTCQRCSGMQSGSRSWIC